MSYKKIGSITTLYVVEEIKGNIKRIVGIFKSKQKASNWGSFYNDSKISKITNINEVKEYLRFINVYLHRTDLTQWERYL